MNLQTMLDQRNITKYRLSKLSGVSQTTVVDICSGKSSIDKCSAKTVFQLAKALNCSMEELMHLDNPRNYNQYGLPADDGYQELGLPTYLQISLDNMKKSWAKEDSGEKDLCWDLYWCELNADINSAEVDNIITSEQAGYLRRKYLRM